MDCLEELSIIGIIIYKSTNRYCFQLAGGKEIETDPQTATDFLTKTRAEEIPISVMYIVPLNMTRLK